MTTHEHETPRKHEMRVGFKGDNRKITVKIPKGDIQPWDLDSSHKFVGSDQSRVDGVQKVTGKARYTYDVQLPGLLQGVLVRSPHPRGKLKSLDFAAAEKMPGVKAIVRTKKDGNRIRFAGDDVAAVAAETIDQALDAIEKIKVEYEVEEHNTNYLFAERAPKRNVKGEVTEPWREAPRRRRGPAPATNAQIEKALKEAAHTRTASYQMEVQPHCSLEPHGIVARFNDDDLEVWASTQATFGVRRGLSGAMRQNGIKVKNLRVHADFVGGGFGSKFQPGAEGVAACLLAHKAKAPVKVMLDRYEEMTCTGNRPSALIQIRAGVKKDGTISVWDYRSWGGPGFSPRGGSTSHPNYYYQGRAVSRNVQSSLVTDTDAGRPMRAPGRPQGYFAAEAMMDELADACGMDPLEFRLQNDSNKLRQTEWRLGAKNFGWQHRHRKKPAPKDQRRVRGAGMSSALWGGQGSDGRGSYGVTCRIHNDGTVEMRNGAQDIGTGMKTVLCLLAAEELQIPPERITAVMGDTNDPGGPASGGSQTTPSLAPAARLAAAQAKEQLAKLVAKHLGKDAGDVVFVGGKVGVQGGKMLSFASACKLIETGPLEAAAKRFPNYPGYQTHVCGCQFAEVEVDRYTGLVKVTRMLAVQDCGLVIAKKLAESQVLGAMIQGVSYALHEQRVIDHRAGRVINGDMLNFKITGAGDMPELEAMMFSVANGRNNVGATGLGEPPIVASAAAIANAVRNALGVPVRSLPITPDKVLDALEQQRKGG